MNKKMFKPVFLVCSSEVYLKLGTKIEPLVKKIQNLVSLESSQWGLSIGQIVTRITVVICKIFMKQCFNLLCAKSQGSSIFPWFCPTDCRDTLIHARQVYGYLCIYSLVCLSTRTIQRNPSEVMGTPFCPNTFLPDSRRDTLPHHRSPIVQLSPLVGMLPHGQVTYPWPKP